MRKRLIWTIKDSYKNYLEAIEEDLGEGKDIKDSVYYMDYKSYKRGMLDFFHEIALAMIREGLNFKMPFRLGYLGIKKDKVTSEKRKPRFDIYNKTGKITSHTNLHTNGFYFFHHWDRTSGNYGRFTNMHYYTFRPNRGNNGLIGKRGLGKWIKKCATDPKLRDYDAPVIFKSFKN